MVVLLRTEALTAQWDWALCTEPSRRSASEGLDLADEPSVANLGEGGDDAVLGLAHRALQAHDALGRFGQGRLEIFGLLTHDGSDSSARGMRRDYSPG